jgi:hypothetical protein
VTPPCCYEDLPPSVGEWTRSPVKNAKDESLGAKYVAVVSTGERAIASSIDTVTGHVSNYSLHQTPVGDGELDWSGPRGFVDRGDYDDRSAGFDALLGFVETHTPRDVAGPTQVTFGELGGFA